MVAKWAKAVSTVSYTEEVCRSLVDALLHIASVDSLRPHIPDGIWAWLKNQPSLPPECPGRSRGTSVDVVRRVRTLGDIEILKSYFLLVWSEWDRIDSQEPGGLTEMGASIREDFSGVEMRHDRRDVMKRLDDVLEQLDRGLDNLKQHKPSLETHHISQAKAQYSELKRVLVEVDGEATKGPACKPLRLIFFDPLTPTDTCRTSLDFCIALLLLYRQFLGTLITVSAHHFVCPPIAFPQLRLSRRLQTFQTYLDVSYLGLPDDW